MRGRVQSVIECSGLGNVLKHHGCISDWRDAPPLAGYKYHAQSRSVVVLFADVGVAARGRAEET